MQHPKVKFELYSGNNENIKDRMEQGMLDMGLPLEPVNIMKYDFIRMKTKEEWGVLIHKDAPLASRDAVRPGDLVGTQVVTVHLNTPVHHELAVWSGDFAKQMESCVKLDCHYDDMKFLPLELKLELSAVVSIDEYLKKLQSEYIDLLLIHQAFNDYYGTWRAMEEAYKEGKVRAIGVSNFYADRYLDLASFAEIKSMVNQLETHVFRQQKK